MGKKRIIKKTEEEILKEKEKLESAFKKGGELKKISRSIYKGRIYIKASYNNIIITLTDQKGDVLSWSSAGSIGFKGTKKSTPFAAGRVAAILAEKAKKIGVREVQIFIKGIGSGRDSAVRSLANSGINIISIKDITPIPHGGCRPPKVRRV